MLAFYLPRRSPRRAASCAAEYPCLGRHGAPCCLRCRHARGWSRSDTALLAALLLAASSPAGARQLLAFYAAPTPGPRLACCLLRRRRKLWPERHQPAALGRVRRGLRDRTRRVPGVCCAPALCWTSRCRTRARRRRHGRFVRRHAEDPRCAAALRRDGGPTGGALQRAGGRSPVDGGLRLLLPSAYVTRGAGAYYGWSRRPAKRWARAGFPKPKCCGARPFVSNLPRRFRRAAPAACDRRAGRLGLRRWSSSLYKRRPPSRSHKRLRPRGAAREGREGGRSGARVRNARRGEAEGGRPRTRRDGFLCCWGSRRGSHALTKTSKPGFWRLHRLRWQQPRHKD